MHSIPQVPCTPAERQQYRELMRRAVEARDQAYTPSSHYNVGGAVIGESGEVYTGANMEFTPNVDHAEQVAMATAFAAGEKGIKALATFGARAGEPKPEDFHDQTPPCGNCRQAAYDVNPGMREIEADGPGEVRVYAIGSELPEAYWRKRDPGQAAACTSDPDPLIDRALLARSRSYSVKSRYPVGAAVETSDHRLFMGVQMEASSYASQALRMALAAARMAGHTDIVRAAVVGGTGAPELPPNLPWDALQALHNVSPDATILHPDPEHRFVEHRVPDLQGIMAR
ncbi:MAG: hypothetical protein HY319_19185 [Armatimonadetes bacterium]|nr:hypothetical protein [Armatimonadota bacterium]